MLIDADTSTWFRDHLNDTAKSIHIDAPSVVLKLFLDLMHHRRLPGLALWAYRVPLFSLADKYGCPGVIERITYGLHHALFKNPWEIFVVASQRGNLSLAKAAMKIMDNTDVKFPAPKVDQLTPELAHGVSLPYFLGLFNAALRVGKAKPEWKDLAEYFVPVKEAGVKG